VESVVINRGKPSLDKIEALYAEGFTKENIVDILVLIGDKTVMNFLHGVTQIPVDFPAAPVLEAVAQ
jgi:alkylhydroperoxidase family enzyme